MRSTKLVLVEGFPGSGKSTTADYLAACLRKAGLVARCYFEVQPDHPLHVGGPLHPSGKTTGEEFFSRYSVESFTAESLERWRAFVLGTVETEAVNVVESYPYQSAARVLLQMDADPSRIHEYIREVESLTQPLAPVLIYLDHLDRRGAVEAVRAISQVRGEAWAAYAIALITACPYCWRRRLEGVDGAVAVLGAYSNLIEELLAQSRLPRLVVTTSDGEWETRYRQILAFLDLPG